LDTLFFKFALGGYFFSTLGYVISLLVKRVFVAKISTFILSLAFLLQSISFGFRCVITKQSPVLNIYDALALLAWVMTGAYLAFQLKTKTRILGAFVSPLSFLFMIIASIKLGGRVNLLPVLQGTLVPIHVSLAVTGEALFALASVAGAMYLLQDSLIKKKRAHSLSRLLPSLRDLDRINHLCLLAGFPLLTVGIVLGSLWARSVWGSHWVWEPKQIWTALVWLLYAFLLHQRLALGWRGHKTAWFSILSFLFLLACVLINMFSPSTLHRFV